MGSSQSVSTKKDESRTRLSPTVTTPETETVNDEVNLVVNAVMKPAFMPHQNEILVYDT